MRKIIRDSGKSARKIDPNWVKLQMGAEEIKGLVLANGNVTEKLASRELVMKHIQKDRNKPQ